jgi:hypothetical protein
MTLTIDRDLKDLIPPLTDEEYAQLEANLVAEGCRDPLVVWQETQTLLDGHHRYEICERHGLTYDVHEISLPDLDAAKAWMIASQLGRRNLSPEQMSYLRGKAYHSQKQEAHRPDNNGTNFVPLRTDEKLAAEHGVSRQTIRNDAAYAAAVDTVAAAVPDAHQVLLARDTKLSRDGVTQLAELATTDSAAAQAALTDIQAAPTMKAAREVLARHVGTGQDQRHEGEASPPPALFTEMEAPVPAEEPTSTLPRQGTGDAERYTPKEWIERVWAVLGTIDVDPASCAMAQAVVQAATFYTLYDNGLHHSWLGTVFLNPPYGMPEVAHFCGKLVEEWDAGRTTAAIVLTNSATETAWFQLLLTRAAVVCLPRKRIAFGHPTRTDAGPPQGQAFFYFGQDPGLFCEVFGPTGTLLHLVGCPVNTDLEDPRSAAEWVIETHGADYAWEMAETIQGLFAQPPAPVAPAALPTPPSAGTVADWLLEVLRAEPAGLTDVQLAKALGIKPVNARFALSRLITEGLVRQIGTTKAYRLVEPKEAP